MSLTSALPATTAATNTSGASSTSGAASPEGDGDGFLALIAGLLDGGTAATGEARGGAASTAELADGAAAAAEGPVSPGSLELSAWLPGLPTAAVIAAAGATPVEGGLANADGAAPAAAGGSAVPGRPVAGEVRGATGQQGAPGLAASAEARTADSLSALGATTGSLEGDATPGLRDGAATASAAGPRGPGDLSSFAAAFQRTQAGGAADALPRGEATATLREPVGSGAWADELGTRLTVMAHQGQYTGSLRLSPEHLGPLEVQIQVGGETTDVFFGAQNADTRAALQEALPRLRELFSAAGLQLGDTGVSHDAPRQDAPAQPAFASATGSDEDRVPASVARAVRAAAIRRHSGLLDTYA